MAMVDFEPGRQVADARVLVEETEMLAAAEAEGSELPRGFELPVVGCERLGAVQSHPRLELSAGEAGEDAIDLGWVEAEPLMGRPKATAELAAQAASATVAIATEQSERLGSFLNEAGVDDHLREVRPDPDLELEPGLGPADLDITAGAANPAMGFRLVTGAQLLRR